MTRILPGVYTNLQDNSALPEGQESLTVGYVLKANRGTINQAELVTNPSDFLNMYTFSGAPAPTDDYTFYTILETLRQTNQVYVVRSAKNALYGGLVVKKETNLGNVISVEANTGIVKVIGDATANVAVGNTIRLFGTTSDDGRYVVTAVAKVMQTGQETYTNITVNTTGVTLTNYTYGAGTQPIAYLTKQPQPLSDIAIGTIQNINQTTNSFIFAEDEINNFLVGDKFTVKYSNNANGTYTVASTQIIDGPTTGTAFAQVTTVETITAATQLGGIAYRNSIATPAGYNFQADDLFLITGKNQGTYNSEIEIGIISSTESPEQTPEPNTFIISVISSLTNTALENPYTVSRVETAKAVDGSSLYIETVTEASDYIQIVNNSNVDATLEPCDTVENTFLSGGYNGDTLTVSDLVGSLDVFTDKTIPISILGNGSIEDPIYQKALISVASSRQDCVSFINSRKLDENATYNSQKATNIKNYKKQTLASTSFYSTMYAPHIEYTDSFNSRVIKLGTDAVAIPGWLSVIRTQGYPFAFAGPQYGPVSATTKWKIGDESGEATLLNDASVNYIAYDARAGRYYMQAQNTLQLANSALRNLGSVLNVLNMKETLSIYLKDYIQLPITTELRKEIKDRASDQFKVWAANNRVTNWAFVDNTSDIDLGNNTLRFVATFALTPYAQIIYMYMNIVNQTYDFSILQS